MQFCKSVLAISLFSIAAGVAASNGQLTQHDLDTVDDSYEIINQAHDNEELKALLDPPKVSDKLNKELSLIRDHARKLNGSLSRSDIITYPTASDSNQVPQINFEAMAEVLNANPTGFYADGSLALFPSDESTGMTGNVDQLKNKDYDNAGDQMVMWIFVSSSMPDHQMRAVLDVASLWGARVVYRGLRPQDHSLNDMIRGVWKLKTKLAETQDDMKMHVDNPEIMEEINKASIYIDPMAFDRFGIDRAPMMVYERMRPDGTKQIGKVRGLISGDYLQSEVEKLASMPNHDGGDIYLGEMGNTFDIVEKSLIEEVKARLERLDMERMKEEALKRYWVKRRFHTLPPTTKDREYTFDPSIVVTDDVVATNGVVLASKGDVVNPLKPYKGHDIVPAHMTMYVFDATDENEVAFVKSMSVNNSRGLLHLLATKIDRNRGFDHLSDLNKQFTIPVTLLTENIINRFNIEVTPTRLVSTDEGMFKINEYSRQSVVQYNMIEADKDILTTTSKITESELNKDSSNQSLPMINLNN